MAWGNDNDMPLCSAINPKEMMVFKFTYTLEHRIAAGPAMFELQESAFHTSKPIHAQLSRNT